MHRAKDGKDGIKLDCYTDLAGKRFIRGAVKQSSMKSIPDGKKSKQSDVNLFFF